MGMRSRIFAIVFLLCTWVAACGPSMPEYSDQTLARMRQYALDQFQALPDATLRSVSSAFDDYVVRLGVSHIEVHLDAYESRDLVNACVSQFEVPPDSQQYMDFTFGIRPNADLRAPIMHGDALSTSFSMDIYNVNPDGVDVAAFLGERIDSIEEGLALAAQYQRLPPEEGGTRGEYTPHLDPYKSAYRIELERPDGDDTAYWDTVYEVLTLYLDAYLAGIESLQPEDNATMIQANMDGIDGIITTIWEEDIIVPMGKLMFGDDMELFFSEAFWRQGVYFSDVSGKTP